MSTLFFEGFDRSVIINKLDSAYWSSQFSQFPKYSFGGFITIDSNPFIQYSASSPNNGISVTGLGNSVWGRSYPALGSPAGFIALSNIDITNMGVEYPTYLQLSGFQQPSGDKSYLGFRALGIETKHTDYSDYPHRHQLLSICSGSNTGLAINVVKITGSYLSNINNIPQTIGLEIEQNGESLGFFDLNISDIVSRYKITNINNNNKILTISDTNVVDNKVPMSRWVHLEFLIDNSDQQQSYLQIRAEGIELPLINSDIEIPKNEWETILPISGFTYNNIRFYNRTYSPSIMNNIFFYGDYREPEYFRTLYINIGKVSILDDITLIDNVGEPGFWLGPTVRIFPLIPGHNNNFNNNGSRPDGITDWTANGGTHREALAFIDGDTKSIETIQSGNIDAVAFSPRIVDFYGYDSASIWRETFNDGIGGIKIYNNSRKTYLDTQYINVYKTPPSDAYDTSVALLLHGNEYPLRDDSISKKNIGMEGSTTCSFSNYKFGNGSMFFPDSNSYIYIDHPNLGGNPFTIEAWVYFNSLNDNIAFFSKEQNFDHYITENTDGRFYSFYLDRSGIMYSGARYETKLLFSSVATTGTWYHVALCRDTGNHLICYLNGQSGTSHFITENPDFQLGEFEESSNCGVVTGLTTNKLYPIVTSQYCEYIDSFSTSYSNYLIVGKAGYIDDYRATTGVNRYKSNFTPSISGFRSGRDNYQHIGPVINVNKTSYTNQQYFSFKNPYTDNNWTLSEMTGLIFGVKKL